MERFWRLKRINFLGQGSDNVDVGGHRGDNHIGLSKKHSQPGLKFGAGWFRELANGKDGLGQGFVEHLAGQFDML